MQSVETGGPLGSKQSCSRPQIFFLYRGNMIQCCTEATKGSDVLYKFKLPFLTAPQKTDLIQERTPRLLPSCNRHFLILRHHPTFSWLPMLKIEVFRKEWAHLQAFSKSLQHSTTEWKFMLYETGAERQVGEEEALLFSSQQKRILCGSVRSAPHWLNGALW